MTTEPSISHLDALCDAYHRKVEIPTEDLRWRRLVKRHAAYIISTLEAVAERGWGYTSEYTWTPIKEEYKVKNPVAITDETISAFADDLQRAINSKGFHAKCSDCKSQIYVSWRPDYLPVVK